MKYDHVVASCVSMVKGGQRLPKCALDTKI